MRVIRCAHRYRINMFRLFFEHFAKVFVLSGILVPTKSPCRPLFIHIAQRHILSSQAGQGAHITATHPPNTNAGHAHPLAGGNKTLPAKHMARNNADAQSSSRQMGQKFPAPDTALF